VVGVAGVLAFSVSGRTREFGIRLAIGSQPQQIVGSVIREGILIAAAGVAGALVTRWLASRPDTSRISAIVASMLPALRAAHVDILEALRTD